MFHFNLNKKVHSGLYNKDFSVKAFNFILETNPDFMPNIEKASSVVILEKYSNLSTFNSLRHFSTQLGIYIYIYILLPFVDVKIKHYECHIIIIILFMF